MWLDWARTNLSIAACRKVFSQQLHDLDELYGISRAFVVQGNGRLLAQSRTRSRSTVAFLRSTLQ